MTLGQPLVRVDQTAANGARARADFAHPATDVLILAEREELRARVVGFAAMEQAQPGVGGDIRDRIVVAGQKAGLGELPVGHVEDPLRLHGVAVDGVFDLHRGVGVEMAETPAKEGRRTHLPHQPADRLSAARRIAGQQAVELLRQVQQNRPRLEHAKRLRARTVDQRRDLRVRIELDEAGPELLALHDLDHPGVVFRVRVPGFEQLLEHDRSLLTVGRAQRIELEAMFADRQVLVFARAGGRAVDPGEAAAVVLVPGPDLGRGIGTVGHAACSSRGVTF